MNELELFKDNEWTLFIILMAALGVNSESFKTYLEEEKRRKEYAEMCPLRYEEHDMGATIPFCRRTNDICDGCIGR